MTLFALAAARLLQFAALKYGPRPSAEPSYECTQCRLTKPASEMALMKCCEAVTCKECVKDSLTPLGRDRYRVDCKSCSRSRVIQT